MARQIKIADRFVGSGHPPFIVAEMSGNHNQSLERALAIVEAAAQAGAHALKLQTYTADSLTIDAGHEDFLINAPRGQWNGQSLYQLYRKAYTPWEWHGPIFERCRELGLIAFSSPFDESAVDFLEKFDVPAYKIASFENNHLPLIRRAAKTGKPLVISTGMATAEGLEEAVKTAYEAGCRDLILLKCTSTYPATPEESNLNTIPDLRHRFDVEVGLSDHTLGIGVSVASVALGAVMIEKHFTLHRAEGGMDAAFSMEPAEMKSLVDESRRAWQSLGQVNYGPTLSEEASLVFRRSIYVVKDVKRGQELTRANVRIIRPGRGLPPKYYDRILGEKFVCDIKMGTPLDWSLIQGR